MKSVAPQHFISVPIFGLLPGTAPEYNSPTARAGLGGGRGNRSNQCLYSQFPQPESAPEATSFNVASHEATSFKAASHEAASFKAASFKDASFEDASAELHQGGWATVVSVVRFWGPPGKQGRKSENSELGLGPLEFRVFRF